MIANRGSHTALPATALIGAPVEKRTYNPGQQFRRRRPTQETSLIEHALAHTPRPALKLNTELRDSIAHNSLLQIWRFRPTQVERSKPLFRIAISPRTRLSRPRR